jgi:glycosyltransferase involved in cell wall biosynthesis
MKHVLLLIKGLGRGGAEQILASSAPYLDTTRFRYEVAYLLPHKCALVGDLQAAGLEVHCLEGTSGAGWVGRLRRLVREREIDLIHLHSPYPAVGARIGLRGPGRPRIVTTEHIGWEFYRRATYWPNLLTFFRNDHAFAVSDQVRRSIRYPAPLRSLPMPPLETLHHGLDLDAVARWSGPDGVREELGVPEEAPVIGTVANFKAHKGYPYLLQAAWRVRAVVPEARFLLVGVGPVEDDIRAQAAEMGLSETVIFAGFRSDVPRVAQVFDIFALASLYEGLSIALIEAMALGKPPVVTAAGGTIEVVGHGENGLLVPPADPDALAEGILSLLRDPPLRERLGEAARRRAADFDIRKAVHRYERVYEELLA